MGNNEKELPSTNGAAIESLECILRDRLNNVTHLTTQMNSITGVPTGFDEFDRMIDGLQKSDLIVLAGRPSMGKTIMALDITFNHLVQNLI